MGRKGFRGVVMGPSSTSEHFKVLTELFESYNNISVVERGFEG